MAPSVADCQEILNNSVKIRKDDDLGFHFPELKKLREYVRLSKAWAHKVKKSNFEEGHKIY